MLERAEHFGRSMVAAISGNVLSDFARVFLAALLGPIIAFVFGVIGIENISNFSVGPFPLGDLFVKFVYTILILFLARKSLTIIEKSTKEYNNPPK